MPHAHPIILGLFEKRIDGDDGLMELARLRFRQAGLGAEMHAGTPDQLDWALGFRPAPETPVVVHLPRDFDFGQEPFQERVVDLAARFAGRVYGFVLHDQRGMAARPEEFIQAARVLGGRLAAIEGRPLLFIEYAVGLAPGAFAGFFEHLRELRQVSACIDVGHVGIQEARAAYAARYPGEDICGLKTDPSKLVPRLDEVQRAVASALPAVLRLIRDIGALGKPVHFHLHDGHPLSTFSPFGVADHLSFGTEIPLSFEYRGRSSVPSMFGAGGLGKIGMAAVEAIGRERASFTLEIHPTEERLSLSGTEGLFSHWKDKTNAERMNHWLSVLTRNQAVLRRAIGAGSAF